MRHSIKIFVLFFALFLGWQKNTYGENLVPPLKMTAVKAECKRFGLQFKVVLTITLDNYSYSNFGPNIAYTITGGSAPITLNANTQVGTTALIHEFQGVGGLNAGVRRDVSIRFAPGLQFLHRRKLLRRQSI